MRVIPAILAFSACSSPGPSDWAEALPDARLLADVDGGAASAARSTGDVSDYQQLTADSAAGANELVDAVLDTVTTVTKYEPTWKDGSSDTALWGPGEDDGVEWQIWVAKDASTGTYDWAIEGRLSGESDWLDLVAGTFAPDGTGSRNGTGEFAFDFDAWHHVDPTEVGGGRAVIAYTVDDVNAHVEVGFEDLTTEEADVVDGGFSYDQAVDGSGGAMDLAVWDDVTENDVPELVILRSRWTADGSGRGDAYVTDGDLGPLVYTATECWDGGHFVTFYEDDADFVHSGDESACVFAEPEFNPAAP